MKSSLQELIDWIESDGKNVNDILIKAKSLLEKEKEGYKTIIQILSTEHPNRQYTHNNST